MKLPYFLYHDIDPYRAVDLCGSWYPNPRNESSYQHNEKQLEKITKGLNQDEKENLLLFLLNKDGKTQEENK